MDLLTKKRLLFGLSTLLKNDSFSVFYYYIHSFLPPSFFFSEVGYIIYTYRKRKDVFAMRDLERGYEKLITPIHLLWR